MSELQIATFGAGCFWGVEETYRVMPGVEETEVGYMGGDLKDPTYEQVCTDKTGHAEVVQIHYDPSKISYEKLLETFWKSHDPTEVNRQGPDVGTQYRSVIFYHTPEQKEIAERSLAEAQSDFAEDVATEIVPAETFYPAEEHHQEYLRKRGVKTCRH